MTDERTVQVRVAVAVNADGEWLAGTGSGWSEDDALQEVHNGLMGDGAGERIFWLTATLPIPRPSEPVEVAADVEEVGGE